MPLGRGSFATGTREGRKSLKAAKVAANEEAKREAGEMDLDLDGGAKMKNDGKRFASPTREYRDADGTAAAEGERKKGDTLVCAAIVVVLIFGVVLLLWMAQMQINEPRLRKRSRRSSSADTAAVQDLHHDHHDAPIDFDRSATVGGQEATHRSREGAAVKNEEKSKQPGGLALAASRGMPR